MSSLPKILIVDDESIVRDTLEDLLAAADLELFFAEDGETGLAVARELQPDAILLDVMMPGMDGYEVCRQIRAFPALTEIPIIMITALDDREARLAGLRAGADDFLTKPFDGLEIQIRIKNIVRLNRYRTLMVERSRFLWVVENDSKGYLVLAGNGNIVYANQRAQVYFHLPEAYHNINFARQAERYYQSHVPVDEQSYQTHGISSYLVQPESTNARAFWLRVEVLDIPLGPENQRLMRVSDVTEEMSTYHDVRKFQTLVVHKLRTPVSHICISLSILGRKIDAIADAEMKFLLQDAWMGTERLAQEMKDILEYLDAPISLAEGVPASLDEIKRIVTAASEILALQDVTIFAPEPMVERKLNISTNAMDLVIFEILENSRKFHPHQTPRVQVRVEAHGENAIALQFLDDGRTMTAEQIIWAKLPYLQSEKWFTGESPGMGLGIPLVAALVWQAGGNVRIENRDDQPGICVRVVLPVLK